MKIKNLKLSWVFYLIISFLIFAHISLHLNAHASYSANYTITTSTLGGIGGNIILSTNYTSVDSIGDIVSLVKLTSQTYANEDGYIDQLPILSTAAIVSPVNITPSVQVKLPANLIVSNTVQTYTGNPHSVAVSTTPADLDAAVVYYPGFNAPIEVGTYYVLVNIVSDIYYGSISSVLTIQPAMQQVVIKAPSVVSVGIPTILSATATSAGPIAFNLKSGNALLVGSTLTALDTGPIVIEAVQAGTTDYVAAKASITILASPYTPILITSNPANQLVKPGMLATFKVVAQGTSPVYQWSLNGNPISGATAATYSVIASEATAGIYTCIVSDEVGSVANIPATLTLNTTRLMNLSTRSFVGDSNLTVGFVTSGDKPKSLLLRGEGPSLNNYGVTGVLSNPILTLYNSESAVLASDIGWGGSTDMSSIFTRLGAFPFDVLSTDSAIVQNLSLGSYTAIVSGVNHATGAAMVEIYDADQGNPESRLTNISSLGYVGTGASIMTGGFVIAGNSTETVLIRAVGPTLTKYGVANVLAQPSLKVFNSMGILIATNTVWSADASLAAAYNQVGAFTLPDSSADSALLITLPAGAYTVQVSGVNATTGNALMEIYEVSTP